MRRRQFLQTLSAAPLATLRAANERPNIVYILADDLGWGDISAYNPQSDIPMANANRLASQGMRFTDMHSPSSVCTPTRYGIMTGRYCWRSKLKSGVLGGYSPNLIEPGRMTVASMLKSKGYYTAGVGKWHLGLQTAEKTDYSQPLQPGPNDHGFDYYFGIPASLDMAPYVYFENRKTVEQPTAHTPGQNEPRGVFWREGPIAPSLKIEQVLPVLADKAVSILKDRAKKKDQPFFLYFPLTGPHTPWMALPEYRGKSKAGDYGDFAVQVDAVLGRVMQTLEETGLAKNTLLIFTSDNGAHWTPEDRQKFRHRANAQWRGQKADIHDAGHRIPFLARWPGKITAGAVSDQTGCLTDLFATAADITGTALPKSAAEDSYSLLPAMLSKAARPIREAIVHHSSQGMFSIRQGEWKLCLGRGSGGFTAPQKIAVKAGEAAGELYNLAKDPGESDNVYLKHPEVVARLTALLDRYKQQGYSRPMS